MKVALVLTLLLVATNCNVADAGIFSFFHTIGDLFKPVAHSLLGTLDNIGGSLVDKIRIEGKSLLSQGLQALTLNTMNALKGSGTTSKRELSGILGNLGSFEVEAKQLIESGLSKLKPLLSNAIDAFKTIIEHVTQFIADPSEVVQMIDHVTGVHNNMVDMILNEIVSSLSGAASKLFTSLKRNVFTDGLSGIITQLKNAFLPAFNGIKTMVSSTGTILKNVAGTLIHNVKNAVSGIASTLSTEGSNAIEAMKSAGADILQQTSHNAQSVVDNIKTTLSNMAGTVVNHVETTLTKLG